MGSSRLVGYILAEMAQTIVFWGLGGACLGVTLESVLEHDYGFFITDALDSDKLLSTSAYVLITGGALLILLGFFGPLIVCINKPVAFYILGACQVAVGVLILLGATLSGIMRIEFKDEQMHEQGNNMITLLQDHYGGAASYDADFTRYWDRLQAKQRCCGPRDSSWQTFRQTPWHEKEPGDPEIDRAYVPESCCFKDRYRQEYNLDKCQRYKDGPPRLLTGENEALYGRGCNYALREWVYEYTRYYMALGFTTGLVACIGVLLPICLGCSLARQNKQPDQDKFDTSMSSFNTVDGQANPSFRAQNYGYYQGRPIRYANSSSSKA